MISKCGEELIRVPELGEMKRQDLTAMVFALDLAVIFFFVIYIYSQKFCIRREAKSFDLGNTTITDFAVRIKNLPSPKEYQNSVPQLKALLALHL